MGGFGNLPPVVIGGPPAEVTESGAVGAATPTARAVVRPGAATPTAPPSRMQVLTCVKRAKSRRLNGKRASACSHPKILINLQGSPA